MATLNILELRQSRNLWKDINIAALSEDDRNQYIKRKAAVDLYIDGLSPKKISEMTGVFSCEIIRLVKKCATLTENQVPIGYEALIPGKHTVKSTSKLQKLFLNYPSLEKYILGNYFNDKKYTLEHNMTIRTLHGKFVKECRRLGIQDYEYPFTLKDNGYVNCTPFVRQYDILSNRWGDLLCCEENRTNGTRRNSRSWSWKP